ncbi:uncharacterized protein LOC111284691 isoform X3 [Durio zibethinus]|uniref:Uncharacterized protein LOC111284691 isoform X3 n=1 Tax=Durio zibethinus TaxID=66656 RepID=A0A6P5XM87_DURZI|nr:uncharacterized protein LOC111284691 isoform X3 [Durio zibethinus]
MCSLLYKSLICESPHFRTQFLNVPAGSPPFPSPPNQNISRRITYRTMSCSSQTSFPTLRTVTISYPKLKDKEADLSMKIEEGFGLNGLGILSITDVPEFPSLRRNLLQLSPRLAGLPEEVKKGLEDPQSRYNFGWSHGKEQLESGKLDLLKGSFYANPLIDVPTNDVYLIERYPSYCGANIWPQAALPELEVAFKALGKLIFDVGLLVAYHCDQYGLTCGLFKRDGVEISCPDSAAGLYIRTRTGQIVKAIFGEDEIAYQIGETTEILSQGYLCATPHCVHAPKGKEASGVDRSTFALFMQPDWDEKLTFPGEVHIHKELISSSGSLTFGEYSELLIDKYYHKKA